MAEQETSRAVGADGESPESLSYIQILLAHLILAGGILLLLALQDPLAAAPRTLLLVAAAVGLLLALPRAFALRRLNPHERVSLAVTLVLILLMAVAGFGGPAAGSLSAWPAGAVVG